MVPSPSLAAVAIITMSVTLGVSLAKKGMVVAARTHLEMLSTISGFWGVGDV